VQVTVANTNGLANGDYVVIGDEGSERAEIVQIANLTPTTFTATLVLDHKVDEPFTKYRYNKRKFYGSVTEAGTFTEIIASGSPVQIQVDDPQGTYIEYSGGEGYIYFKSTYFNSSTSDETLLSEAIAVLADESIRYCSIHDIRDQAGLTMNPYITDGAIEIKRQEAESEVDSYLSAMYLLPLTNSQGVKEVPKIVQYITTMLAAGFLDYKEFGADGQGVKWLGEARGMLKKLADGTMSLTDSLKQEFGTKTNTTGVNGYPLDSSGRMFTINQQF
jgi:phage gp36-like protein